MIPVGAVEADDLVVGKNELDGYGLPASPRAMLGDLPETAVRADFKNPCGYLPRVKPLTFEVLGVDKDVADGLHRVASLCELPWIRLFRRGASAPGKPPERWISGIVGARPRHERPPWFRQMGFSLISAGESHGCAESRFPSPSYLYYPL